MARKTKVRGRALREIQRQKVPAAGELADQVFDEFVRQTRDPGQLAPAALAPMVIAASQLAGATLRFNEMDLTEEAVLSAAALIVSRWTESAVTITAEDLETWRAAGSA